MKTVLVQCWQGGNPVMNLGEWFCEWILAKLGYGIRYSPRDAIEPGEPVLMVIGSDLNSFFVDEQLPRLGAAPREIHAWGAGNGRDPIRAMDLRSLARAYRIHVHALRGPVTRTASNAGSVPICDPGFLMPWALKDVFPHDPNSDPDGETLYVPHWEDRDDAEARCATIGAAAWLDVLMHRENVLPAIERIVRASLVLTSTLHTAILCIAYGTPWALHLPPHRREPTMPWKWIDVFSSIGAATPKPVRTAAEGMAWWRKHHRRWIQPDIEALIESFPHFLAREVPA